MLVSDPRANRGYVKQGRERVTNSTDPDVIAELRRTTPDVKESMEIGLETGLLFPFIGQKSARLAQIILQIQSFGITGLPLIRAHDSARQ